MEVNFNQYMKIAKVFQKIHTFNPNLKRLIAKITNSKSKKNMPSNVLGFLNTARIEFDQDSKVASGLTAEYEARRRDAA